MPKFWKHARFINSTSNDCATPTSCFMHNTRRWSTDSNTRMLPGSTWDKVEVATSVATTFTIAKAWLPTATTFFQPPPHCQVSTQGSCLVSLYISLCYSLGRTDFFFIVANMHRQLYLLLTCFDFKMFLPRPKGYTFKKYPVYGLNL